MYSPLTSCYSVTLYLLIPARIVLNTLISALPIKLQKRLDFELDTARSIFYLIFGKLLPDLHIPDKDLTRKTAIVTGSNSGIGFQIASDLAQRNATVYLACRTKSKADEAVNAIITKHPHARGRVLYLQLDTSSPQNVRECAKLWSEHLSQTKIDILVHNAGIAEPPSKTQNFTSEGLEITYATNFLGSFLLTFLLEEHLTPETARVVFTSSTAQSTGKFSHDFAMDSAEFREKIQGRYQMQQMEPGFHHPVSFITMPFLGRYQFESKTPFMVYSNTKAMQCAFARCLQQRFNRKAKLAGRQVSSSYSSSASVGQVAHCFSPDLTSTPILTKGDLAKFWSNPAGWLLSKVVNIAIDTSQGAATGTWLAICDDEGVVNPAFGGAYWDRMNRFTSYADLLGQEQLDRLWTRWENDAGIQWH